jgi:drug/metabolite transporter (DMT)-like permease
MIIGTALAAAICYAMASVLQHRAARRETSPAMRARFLLALASRPSWLLGIAADLGAFVLQFLALQRGSIVFVQPVLASGLLFALPVSAALEHRRLSRMDWIGAVAVVVGLSIFLVEANPASGEKIASPSGWFFVSVITLVPGIVLAAAGILTGIKRFPGLLAAAAGFLFGMAAALTKASAALSTSGLLHLFRSWELYGLVIVGVGATLCGQSAFSAGPLHASLPLQSAIEPVISVIVGVIGFGESLSDTFGALSLQVTGLVLAAAGLWILGRSPVLDEPAPRWPGSLSAS